MYIWVYKYILEYKHVGEISAERRTGQLQKADQ